MQKEIQTVELRRLTTTNNEIYEEAMELYRSSFPYNEQREPAQQKAIMTHPEYYFQLIYDEDIWVGMILLWETDEFVYAEHFCILPDMRNKHYGEKTLQLLKSQCKDKKVILEIDPPVDDISIRRKGFYERLGFVENGFAHIQPPFHKGEKGVPLRIMSCPVRLSDEEYERFYEYMKRVVFGE